MSTSRNAANMSSASTKLLDVGGGSTWLKLIFFGMVKVADILDVPYNRSL